MPILHLDTQAVRQLAQQLALANDDLLRQAQNLQTRLAILQMGWTGNSSNDFQVEMGLLIGRLRRLADEADNLHLRLKRKVDEWEEVDSYF